MSAPAMPKTAPEAPAPAGKNIHIVELPPVDEGGEQVAGGAGEDVDREQSEGAHQRLGEKAEVPQAPHVGGQMKDSHVEKHGGKDSDPLVAEQHVAGVVGAPVHQLIHRGVEGADSPGHHGQKDGAIDADQQIGGRRGSPQRTPARRLRRRKTAVRRPVTPVWRQNFGHGVRGVGGGILSVGWKNGGMASHSFTLLHFRLRGWEGHAGCSLVWDAGGAGRWRRGAG